MNSAHPPGSLKAVHDVGLQARIVRRLALYYALGADVTVDRPAHVRAASGLAWAGGKLVVVQDDANFIALVDVHSGTVESITLPAGAFGKRLFDDYRGNKADKNDFESLLSTTLSDGAAALFLFGSGSTARREHIAIVQLTAATPVRLIHAPALYAALRSCREFAGSELNVEGAVRMGDIVRLFGRGNGEVSDEMVRVNAYCDLNWFQLLEYLDHPSETVPPLPTNVTQFDLGELGGTRITFTDAAEVTRGTGYPFGAMVYTGTAEASVDVVMDGPVEGSVIGIISEQQTQVSARYTEICEADGRFLRAKVEGVALGDFARGQVFVVVDADDHDVASELLELKVTGVAR